MKSSELLKAIYLDKQNKLPFTRAVSSLLLDKILNLVVLSILVLIGLFFVDIIVPRVIPLCALCVIVAAIFSAQLRFFFVRIAEKITPRFHKLTRQLLSSFECIKFKETAILLFYSFIYQLSEFLNTYILLKAVGVTVPFTFILIIIPVIMIINNLPISILGLGTREASIVFFFSNYGSSAALLSGSILISFVEHILPVIAGLFFVKSFYTFFMMKDDVFTKKMETK